MFVEHKEALEVTEAPAKTLKLSEAIRKGLPLVTEDRKNWRFCALGAAFAGVRGHEMTNDEAFEFVLQKESPPDLIADALGFSRDVCRAVNDMHYNGCPATYIADWLEAHGY